MSLDMSKLTMAEVAKIEELSGQSITEIGEESTPKGLALAAMALVTKRREGDPKFTWNQACGLTFDEANEILGLSDEDETEDEADPTDPEPEATAPSKSGSKPRRTAKPEAPKA